MITGSVGVQSTGSPSAASYSGTIDGAKSASDYMSGSVTLQVGSGASNQVTIAQVAAYAGEGVGSVTLTQLEQYINADTSLGVSASINASNDLTLSSTGASAGSALKVTSNLTDTSVGTGTALNYTATPIYSVSIGAETNVYDVVHTTAATPAAAATDVTNAETLSTAVLGNTNTGGSLATISYTDKAGISLSGTDLLDTADAQTALNDLNTAISDVAAQDGYIGAQINTLNSISQVMSTQQENVVSAQNAIQATDYAAATSNMSKYEILSQTGIAALAQANSVQQEVTKLLQ
jgi:flagellin